MGKKLLVTDLDDVLFPFVPNFIEFNNREYGTNFELKDITNFHIGKIFGCDREEFEHRLDKFFAYSGHVMPAPHSQEGIRQLKREYSLLVVSSRLMIFDEMSVEWVERHYPGCFSGIYVLGDLSPTERNNIKTQFCVARNAKILIEDGPQNAYAAAEAGIRVILPDKNWNQGLEHRMIKRVPDRWPDITNAALRYS